MKLDGKRLCVWIYYALPRCVFGQSRIRAALEIVDLYISARISWRSRAAKCQITAVCRKRIEDVLFKTRQIVNKSINF